MFAPLGFVPGLTPDQIAAVTRRGGWAAAGVPTVEHYMDLGSSFAGTPGQLVDRLKAFEERYPGMQHISLSNRWHARSDHARAVSMALRGSHAGIQTAWPMRNLLLADPLRASAAPYFGGGPASKAPP
jgi:hypothetical protein